MKKISLIIGVTVAILMYSTNVLYSQITGVEIMTKVYEQPSGDDTQGELTMTLTNKNGETRVRIIQQYIKTDATSEKKIMFFMSPADVKNTSFMNWSYDDDNKADDQWIYLPALKKVKRISSDSKSDYFMGSDFTYDDLGDRKLSADNHKLLREETKNNKACYVVESKSKDEDYIYSKTITWVDKSTFVGVQKEFYDEDGELLKTLMINKVEKIAGFYVITNSEMINVQKNHSTTIVLSNVKVNSGISSDMFSERMMMRGM